MAAELTVGVLPCCPHSGDTAAAGSAGDIAGAVPRAAEGHGATGSGAQFRSWRLQVQASSLQPRVLHVPPPQHPHQHQGGRHDGSAQPQQGDSCPDAGRGSSSDAAAVVAASDHLQAAAGVRPRGTLAMRASFTVTATPVLLPVSPAAAAETLSLPAASEDTAASASVDVPPKLSQSAQSGSDRPVEALRLQPQAPPPLEVLFRCRNKYLPIRLCSWRLGGDGNSYSNNNSGKAASEPAVDGAAGSDSAASRQGSVPHAAGSGGCMVEWAPPRSRDPGVGLRLQPAAAQPPTGVPGAPAAGNDVANSGVGASDAGVEPQSELQPLQHRQLQVEVEVDATELQLLPGLALMSAAWAGARLLRGEGASLHTNSAIRCVITVSGRALS